MNEGSNHRFCTRTIKKKFKSWDTNGGLPRKKSLFARPTKKLAASGVRREQISN
jgi:hypothetical protein